MSIAQLAEILDVNYSYPAHHPNVSSYLAARPRVQLLPEEEQRLMRLDSKITVADLLYVCEYRSPELVSRWKERTNPPSLKAVEQVCRIKGEAAALLLRHWILAGKADAKLPLSDEFLLGDNEAALKRILPFQDTDTQGAIHEVFKHRGWKLDFNLDTPGSQLMRDKLLILGMSLDGKSSGDKSPGDKSPGDKPPKLYPNCHLYKLMRFAWKFAPCTEMDALCLKHWAPAVCSLEPSGELTFESYTLEPAQARRFLISRGYLWGSDINSQLEARPLPCFLPSFDVDDIWDDLSTELFLQVFKEQEDFFSVLLGSLSHSMVDILNTLRVGRQELLSKCKNNLFALAAIKATPQELKSLQ